MIKVRRELDISDMELVWPIQKPVYHRAISREPVRTVKTTRAIVFLAISFLANETVAAEIRETAILIRFAARFLRFTGFFGFSALLHASLNPRAVRKFVISNYFV